MHTTDDYSDLDQQFARDEALHYRPTSGALEAALSTAQVRADELAADTNEPLIARAYGRIFTQLQELQTEAAVIDRIANGA